MTQERNAQGRGATLERNQDIQPEIEFDQWAIAVRQQMVAALKRRGNR